MERMEEVRRWEAAGAPWSFLCTALQRFTETVNMYLPDFVCTQCIQLIGDDAQILFYFISISLNLSHFSLWFFPPLHRLVMAELYFVTPVIDEEANGQNH